MELPKFSPTHSFRFISSTTGEVETTKAIPKGLPFFVGAIATWSNKGGNWVFSFRDFGWRTKAPTLTMNSKGGSNLVWRFCLAELYTFTFRILFRWHFGLVNSTLFTPPKKNPTQTTLEECPQRPIYSPNVFESIEVAGIEWWYWCKWLV